MDKLTTTLLGKIAVGIMLTGCSGLYVTRWILQNKIGESVSYKEAMQCLRSNPNAVELLGEPIIEKKVEVGDNKCYGRRDNVMWVTVPLQGKNRSGNLYYWVTMDDPKNTFIVSKVEFGIDQSATRISLKKEVEQERTITPVTESVSAKS